MSRVRCRMALSLDGFVAGPRQSLAHPLGEGGPRLHAWAFPTRTFRALHGDGGSGETGVNDEVLREAFENLGATIMGRNMFGPERGPWGADPCGTEGTDYTKYIDWNTVQAGREWAEWTIEQMGGKGQLLYEGGPAGNTVSEGNNE